MSHAAINQDRFSIARSFRTILAKWIKWFYSRKIQSDYKRCERVFRLSRHFTSVMYSSGKSLNYFLRMHAKTKTFWVALYNGASLIVVWLLLSYR
jgi:hypothetical protein